MFEESRDTPDFEIDTKEFCWGFELCWICKNRHNCPTNWECETIENMDNDDTNDGVDEA